MALEFETLKCISAIILSTIDCPRDVLSNALDGLCDKKIIKYSGTYDRYDFYDASIYDVEAMIEEESFRIGEDSVIKALNDYFVDFVLYPYRYNRDYRYSCRYNVHFKLDRKKRRGRYRSIMAVLKEIPLSLGTLRVTSPEVVVRLRL